MLNDIVRKAVCFFCSKKIYCLSQVVVLNDIGRKAFFFFYAQEIILHISGSDVKHCQESFLFTSEMKIVVYILGCSVK